MSVITYSGSIQPAVFLSFKTIKVSGARTSANEDFLYQVENESLFEIYLWARTPAGVYRLQRRAMRSRRLFSSVLNTYVMEATPAAALNAILDGQAAGRLDLFATVRIRYKPFFYQVLKSVSLADSSTYNLARPQDAAPIEASFIHRRVGGRARIQFPDDQRLIRDIPCLLSGYDVRPSPRPGRAPQVKLYLYLQVKERLSAQNRDETARIFVSADYSKVYQYGRLNRPRRWWRTITPRGIEVSLSRWEKNVANYLWSHTSFTRGERLRREIMNAGVAEMAHPQLEVVQAVRNRIDERLITANHWGDLREDWNTEQYQRKMSDAFGTIHQNRWYASPVRFIRDLSDSDNSEGRVPMQVSLLGFRDPLNLDQHAALILQFGTGHCGEHGQVSYSVIRGLMNSGHEAKFYSVTNSGNANVDHAFVIGGIRVDTYIRTRRRHAFGSFTVGEVVYLVNLRDTLAANPGRDGFVLDPYLAPSRQAQTVRELLTRIDSPRRGSRRTEYVSISEQHPTTPIREDRTSVRGV